jgi:hypothetical protein
MYFNADIAQRATFKILKNPQRAHLPHKISSSTHIAKMVLIIESLLETR